MWGNRAALDESWDATHLESMIFVQTHAGGGRDDHAFNVWWCIVSGLLHMNGVVAARG